MKKHFIQRIAAFIAVNSLFSFFLIFIGKMFRNEFKIEYIIHWMQEDTTKFAIYFFIFFLALFSTFKIQLKIYNKLKNQYPWVLVLSKYLLIFLLLFGLSFIINYYFQYFQTLKDPLLTNQWIGEKPKAFFAGVLYLLILFLLIFVLVGNIYISSFITSIFLLTIGFIHYNKLNLRGEPLYPGDYNQISNLKDVIPMIRDYLSINQVISVVFIFVLVGIVMFLLPKLKIAIWMRGLIFVISLIMIYSFTYFPNTFMKSLVEKSDIEIVKWNQIYNYQTNGFLFGFVLNLQNKVFEEPEGYSKQKVEKTVRKYLTSSDSSRRNEKSPNIIYLMSETFWDPTKLNIGFSEDPIRNIRQFMTNYSSGQILSSNFGGGTANVEFEALTGFTMSFLNEGAIPYQDLVPQQTFIPTIVSDLENKGYKSLAIHPGSKVFYKRNLVYKTLGFDKFLDEGTMTHTERAGGGLITDESLTLEILDNIKNQDKPMFIHSVSIQNHMPYLEKNYPEYPIEVSGLEPESISQLKVYAEGLRRSDEAFKFLVDQLEQIGEPTIVVFWGDHLPILGEDYSVYKEAGYHDKDPKVRELKYFETPLLIYSNFDTEHYDLNTISPIYLAPIVYEMMGLEKPPFYNLLDQLRNEIPAMKGTAKVGSDQKLMTKLTKKQEQLLEDYKLIEYDLLRGKQYSMKSLFPQKK
ncbi:LTA synthase family protein [Neobacillus drentensis]|uniref:LTA synthase family protein n=1 Tax=Neobacillus drentensis TaxID=220684 RepID=UPI00300074EC